MKISQSTNKGIHAREILGIKDLQNRSSSLYTDFLWSRKRLYSTMTKPSVTLSGKSGVKAGTSIELNVKGFPLPDVDLWNGKLLSNEKQQSAAPILISFRGLHHPVIVPAVYDEKRGKLHVEVPEDADDGAVVVLFPVREFMGKLDELIEVDENRSIIDRVLGNVVACNCEEEQDDEEDSPELCMHYTLPNTDQIFTTRYVTSFAAVIHIKCSVCSVNCPNGAICIDEEGDCYVDVEFCQGQSYRAEVSSENITTPDGRSVRKQGFEIKCWDCFEGSEEYSSKCKKRKLRKVAYVGYPCCMNCQPEDRKILGLNLEQLCPYGAVTMSSGYKVDPNICEGCFLCIYYIACQNNFSCLDISQRTLRMVAHLSKPETKYYFYPDSIRFNPSETIQLSPEMIAEMLEYKLILNLESEISSERLHFNFNDGRIFHFDENRIEMEDHLNITLLIMSDSGTLDLVEHGDSSLVFPIKNINISPHQMDDISLLKTLYFTTAFGVIELRSHILSLIPFQ